MKNIVIAITRTCGSGAMTIGKELAEFYGIDLYDRKLLQLASEDSGINEELFGRADENVKRTLLYSVSKQVYHGELIPPESDNFTSDQNLFNYQAKVLKELAEKESYIVIGRAGDFVLRDYPNCISVYLYGDRESCITHMMNLNCCGRKEAIRYIDNLDRFRNDYYVYHTGRRWKNADNYDLSLNTTRLGFPKCVELIKQYISLRTDE